MGGQACVVYGAAEFSRDIDLAVTVSSRNLRRLRAALMELKAEEVFVPPLSSAVLRRGHGCHFRCTAQGVERLRIDVMGKQRGLQPFSSLWRRREEIRFPGVGLVPVMSLPDLVVAKKTQRDKDWPMIRRLVEADIHRATAVDRRAIRFWLRECRTPELLVALAARFPQLARHEARRRPLLEAALAGKTSAVAGLLEKEQLKEKTLDREYWQPLRKELQEWRRRLLRK